MNAIKISKKDREKQYIKEELMRYHMYEVKIKELEEEIFRFKLKYRDILNDPPIGGSIIKMPDGTPNNRNIVMRLEYRLNDLETNLRYYKDRIDILNNWLGVLTEKQNKVARVYIMQYQCQNVHDAALDLGYAESTLKDYPDQIYERIRKKVSKIF